MQSHKEHVSAFPAIADSVCHLQVRLPHLQNMGAVVLPIGVLRKPGERLCDVQHLWHGSRRRIAETMELVFQAAISSAAFATTVETRRFAHGFTARIGLSKSDFAILISLLIHSLYVEYTPAMITTTSPNLTLALIAS